MVPFINPWSRATCRAREGSVMTTRARIPLPVIGISVSGSMRVPGESKMEGRKDISDMTFEEFFSEPVGRSEGHGSRDKGRSDRSGKRDPPEIRRGFVGAVPKVNYTGGRFQLYVPRYTGSAEDQFNVAIDCSSGVIPMGRLESVSSRGVRTTRPSTLDLTSVDVYPLDAFTLTIDGRDVFVNKPQDLLFFNNMGLPMNKPAGDTVVIHRPQTVLRTVRCEGLGQSDAGPYRATHLEVSLAGGVWVDEDATVPVAGGAPAPVVAEPEPVAAPVKKQAAKAKRVRVKGTLELSEPVGDAEILFEGRNLPLYAAPPLVSATVTGCGLSDCNVRITGPTGSEVTSSVAAEHLRFESDDLWGPLRVVLERGGKSLAETECFIIPGFSCSYSGHGDIPDDPEVRFSMFGEDHAGDIFEESAYGPFTHEGIEFRISWIIPAVTYDLGSGPRRFAVGDVDASELDGDDMVITVRGARKKSLFFGGEKGKKRDITPDWDGDTYRVNLAQIRDEIYAAPSTVFCFYITVNSFPNRRFLTVRNPVRLRAVYSDGAITAEVDDTVPEAVCVLYMKDKTSREVPLSPGANSVPVDDGVVEAEVLERSNGRVRVTVPVPVRELPFLDRDQTGSWWMYVSRSKRIPLPDGLITGDGVDLPAVRSWHDRIVRMNPELRGITFPMMQRAFESREA